MARLNICDGVNIVSCRGRTLNMKSTRCKITVRIRDILLGTGSLAVYWISGWELEVWLGTGNLAGYRISGLMQVILPDTGIWPDAVLLVVNLKSGRLLEI